MLRADLVRALELFDPRGRAVVLGATIAIGSCTFAGCADEEAHADPIPPLTGLRPIAPEIEEEPEEEGLALEAERGRVGTFDASPGFTPDPLAHEGALAGGPFDAHELDERCSGWIGGEPDFVIDAPRPFAELAVMVASEEDTTLVIMGPDEEARCADDDEGHHPIVRGLFGSGIHRVWIGAEESGSTAPYVLALSELDDSTPSALLH